MTTPTPEIKPSFLNASGFTLLQYPDEPAGRFFKTDFDKFLVWCSNNNVSDVNLTTNEKVMVETSGRKMRATRREFSNVEVSEILAGLYGSDSIIGELNKGEDRDFAYDLKPDRDTRYRYRVNATGLVSRGMNGINVTLRTISSKPILLADLKLEEEIFRAMAPHQGMVAITGSTGSGKSTLLSSMLRHLVEEKDGNRKVLTYESPIEYVYDELEMPSSLVCQSEVPRNLPSFSAGTRNSLRRAPDIILVGEARDPETVAESITASMTGHALYTTVHSNDFSSTIPRMINLFPEGERNARAADLIQSLCLVVSQRLMKTPDGGRVALREFVVFTPQIREMLLGGNLDTLSLTAKNVLDEFGQSFLQDARRKFAEGRLSAEQLREEELRDDATRRDAQRSAKLGQAPSAQPVEFPLVSTTASIVNDDQPTTERATRAPAGVVKVPDPSAGGDHRLDSLGGGS